MNLFFFLRLIAGLKGLTAETRSFTQILVTELHLPGTLLVCMLLLSLWFVSEKREAAEQLRSLPHFRRSVLKLNQISVGTKREAAETTEPGL